MQSSQRIVYNDEHNYKAGVKDEDHMDDSHHDYDGNSNDSALNVSYKLS